MEAIDLIEILPELCLLLIVCFILLVTPFIKEPLVTDEDVFYTPRGANLAYYVALVVLLILSIVFALKANDMPQLLMNGLYQVDPLSNILKSVSSLAVLVTLIYSKQYLIDRDLFRTD
jgi:NADH-quinone oxidoreductase subunit N